jgi:hypothetical protein
VQPTAATPLGQTSHCFAAFQGRGVALPLCNQFPLDSGWHILWAAYHQSYRSKQLFGANAVGIFETYHKGFPRAQTAKEKMLMIDQLIHAFHISLKEGIGRPVAANLIEGSLKDVIRFLDQLTSGEASATGIGNSRTAWKQTLSTTDWSQVFMESNDHPQDAPHA